MYFLLHHRATLTYFWPFYLRHYLPHNGDMFSLMKRLRFVICAVIKRREDPVAKSGLEEPTTSLLVNDVKIAFRKIGQTKYINVVTKGTVTSIQFFVYKQNRVTGPFVHYHYDLPYYFQKLCRMV